MKHIRRRQFRKEYGISKDKVTLMNFIEKVNVKNECWNWIGTKNHGGYGIFCGQNTHRWSYKFFKGAIGNKLTVDHLCRNRKCVNPEHLRLINFKENVLIGNSPPAINSRKEVCKNGHVLFPYSYRGKTYRRCRTCHAINARKYRKLRIKLEHECEGDS